MRTVRLISLLFVAAFLAGCAEDQPLAPADPGPTVTKPLFDHAPPPVSSAVIDVNNYELQLEGEFLFRGRFKGTRVLFSGALAYGNSANSILFVSRLDGASDFTAVPGLPIEVLEPGPFADHQTLSLIVESVDGLPEPTQPLGLLVGITCG